MYVTEQRIPTTDKYCYFLLSEIKFLYKIEHQNN